MSFVKLIDIFLLYWVACQGIMLFRNMQHLKISILLTVAVKQTNSARHSGSDAF